MNSEKIKKSTVLYFALSAATAAVAFLSKGRAKILFTVSAIITAITAVIDLKKGE